MGKPQNPREFREIQVDGLHIYVHRDILKDLDRTKRELKFVVEGYGWFRLPLQEALMQPE